MLAMEKHAYGHRPPDIGATDFGGGWIRGVRHLASRSAKGSFWHRHEETAVVCCLRGEYTYEALKIFVDVDPWYAICEAMTANAHSNDLGGVAYMLSGTVAYEDLYWK